MFIISISLPFPSFSFSFPFCAVWSYGVCLYEMVELDVPYHDIDVHERFEAEMRGERPNITKKRDGDKLFEQILIQYMECTNRFVVVVVLLSLSLSFLSSFLSLSFFPPFSLSPSFLLSSFLSLSPFFLLSFFLSFLLSFLSSFSFSFPQRVC